MKDYTKTLPKHIEKYIGENDLFLEIFEGEVHSAATEKSPPLLFVHGAYTGSWMWSKYIPHFISKGWKCYVMNMRSHYKSRVLDLTKVSFEDYLEDIKEVIVECGEPPIIMGFSMGGILCQKLAETITLAGLVLIDTSISKEVNEIAPYKEIDEITPEIIAPAPTREECSSIDESEDDIAFQKKYLTMESSNAMSAFAFSFGVKEGISVDSGLITYPCLVIKSVNSDDDDRRGRATAEHLNAEYTGLWNTTHTGLLVGQRYMEVVDRIMEWFKKHIEDEQLL
ncbi:alpha/beta fold hydrolase [Clostridium sp. FP2]|uniref:alpha/beta hydrolase n=1 Tax=Clostridium sp. FP2 TaxID=2724481 RepID=UPI0013E97C6E|nr:alpha/beta hydrolase family protein [Clostridium sp. FP2]MBZ9623170.1 alpha/beta fold hydrolase [Clostridium sp. FP2]